MGDDEVLDQLLQAGPATEPMGRSPADDAAMDAVRYGTGQYTINASDYRITMTGSGTASTAATLSMQSLRDTRDSMLRSLREEPRQVMTQSHRLYIGETIRLDHNFQPFTAPEDGHAYWTEGDNYVDFEPMRDRGRRIRLPLIPMAEARPYRREYLGNWDHVEVQRPQMTPAEVATWIDEAAAVGPADLAGIQAIINEGSQAAFSLPQEEKKEDPPNMKANMGYIQMLMANYGFRLSVDQMRELAILPDKSDINKKMADFYELHKAGKPIGPDEEKIIEQASSDLQQFFKHRFEARKEEIKKEIEIYKKDADRHFTEANAKLLRMNEKVVEFDQMKDDGTEMKSVFDAIKGNSFWRIEKYRDGIMYFESQDVILRHVDRAQNVDMTVNFGPMWLMWVTRSGTVKMDETRGKYIVNGHMHPHINSSGSICWGNAASSYTTHMKTYQINEVLKIVQSLLQTYNPGSPFQRLDRFFAKSNPSVQKGEFEHRPVRWAWVYDDGDPDDGWDFTPDFAEDPQDEEWSDADGNRVRKIRVYHRFNREFGIQVDENEYIRSTNFRYFVLASDRVEINEDDVNTEDGWNEQEENEDE